MEALRSVEIVLLSFCLCLLKGLDRDEMGAARNLRNFVIVKQDKLKE